MQGLRTTPPGGGRHRVRASGGDGGELPCWGGPQLLGDQGVSAAEQSANRDRVSRVDLCFMPRTGVLGISRCPLWEMWLASFSLALRQPGSRGSVPSSWSLSLACSPHFQRVGLRAAAGRRTRGLRILGGARLPAWNPVPARIQLL